DMRGDEPVVTADDLDRDAKPAQLGDCALRVRFGGILENEKPPEGHLRFVDAIVVGLRHEAPRGEREDSKSLSASRSENRFQGGTVALVERPVRVAVTQERAG